MPTLVRRRPLRPRSKQAGANRHRDPITDDERIRIVEHVELQPWNQCSPLRPLCRNSLTESFLLLCRRLARTHLPVPPPALTWILERRQRPDHRCNRKAKSEKI